MTWWYVRDHHAKKRCRFNIFSVTSSRLCRMTYAYSIICVVQVKNPGRRICIPVCLCACAAFAQMARVSVCVCVCDAVSQRTGACMNHGQCISVQSRVLTIDKIILEIQHDDRPCLVQFLTIRTYILDVKISLGTFWEKDSTSIANFIGEDLKIKVS